MTDQERKIMRHALGLTISDKSYRNFYVAGTDAIAAWEPLVARGLAEGEFINETKSPGWKLYHVTDKGREALDSPNWRLL